MIFACYLDEAAEGFFHFMLGRKFAEIVARAYCKPDNDYFFQNVIFAERDNEIVGMASAYTCEQHRNFKKQPLRNIAGCRSLRMMVISALFAPLLRIIDTLDVGYIYLQAIATNKEIRGEGIGSFFDRCDRSPGYSQRISSVGSRCFCQE